MRPSSLTSRVLTAPVWPVRVSRTSPERTSQTSTRPSPAVVASVRPSALNASARTRSSCRPPSVRRSPVRRSRMATLPSSPPRAALRPSGDRPRAERAHRDPPPHAQRRRVHHVRGVRTRRRAGGRVERGPSAQRPAAPRPMRTPGPKGLPVRASYRRRYGGRPLRRVRHDAHKDGPTVVGEADHRRPWEPLGVERKASDIDLADHLPGGDVDELHALGVLRLAHPTRDCKQPAVRREVEAPDLSVDLQRSGRCARGCACRAGRPSRCRPRRRVSDRRGSAPARERIPVSLHHADRSRPAHQR